MKQNLEKQNIEKPDSSAVVILSGGLDSTVALAEVLTQRPVSLVLTFDYGQRAFAKEKAAASALSKHYQLTHEVIDLPWLAQAVPQALQPGVKSDADPMALSTVWVPNRNGVFLNIAASFAEARQSSAVVFGANAEEGVDFPDNAPAFTQAITRSLAYSTLNQVKVLTPVGHLNKPEILALGLKLHAPLNHIWSCYQEGEQHCGQCASCRRLRNAILANGKTPEALGIHFEGDAGSSLA